MKGVFGMLLVLGGIGLVVLVMADIAQQAGSTPGVARDIIQAGNCQPGTNIFGQPCPPGTSSILGSCVPGC